MAFLDYTGLKYFYGKVLARIKGLTAEDVGAVSSSYVDEKITDCVPISRTINSKALSADLTLSASDVGAATETYVDQQVAQIASSGVPKLMVYPLEQTATTDGQTTFPINLDTFVAETDTVLVQSGRTMLSPVSDFTVSGTNVVLTEGVISGTTITIYVFKNVPIGEEGSISGAVLLDGSIPADKLAEAYLPLTGGELSGLIEISPTANKNAIIINRNLNGKKYSTYMSGASWVSAGGKTPCASIAWFEDDVEVVKFNFNDVGAALQFITTTYDDDGSITQNSVFRELFGQHNKPTGLYTGTGDATEFTIDVGSVSGYELLYLMGSSASVYSQLLVGAWGAMMWTSAGEFKTFTHNELQFFNSTLRIKTDDKRINAAGANYRYIVL